MTHNNISEEEKSEDRPWHALNMDEVMARLRADEKGLSREEARRRLDEYGPNMLPAAEKPGALIRFLRQFNNMLIYILLAAAAFTAFLGEWIDTGVILAVVIINAVIGFIQEGKAERAMEAIQAMLSQRTTALRDGEEHELPAEELVPGDIVLLGAGDRVPADIRVLHAPSAQVEEAALTGESEPVSKQSGPVERDAPLGDRRSMAYSGTLITGGRLRGIVVTTGSRTEIGRIGEMVSQVEEISTPLLRKIDQFGRMLSVAIVLLSAAVFAAGYFLRGFSATEMFMVVVSLAVAAIPEGLPAIMTITLALGVQRMAKRNAIVRKLPAVETLGSVTTICSDKTGTLTRNEMTVAKVVVSGKIFTVSGVGYRPEGELSLDGRAVSPEDHPPLLELARVGLLVSDARLRKENGSWKMEGAPTEAAVVVMGYKAGLTRREELDKRPRIDEIPFESERRFMATLHKESEGVAVYIKGAPERVLEMCSMQRAGEEDQPLEKDGWSKRVEALADNGHRVLAIAAGRAERAESFEDIELQGFTLLGLVGIIDPPRPEAVEAIKECRTAGIKVKMITGDHVLTARSIGASMGIGDGRNAVSGRELERVDGEELVDLVLGNDVFARASPEHKLRIVEALQSKGQVVAMTGDGVNDAPALKRADVGVAMGIKGSGASKEAADMVLADDNFATIERAVEEGRTIYDNLLKTILFILPTNGAEALMVITSVLFLFEVMPITPIQILWVNMVTAVTLALAMAFEPAEAGIMRRPPRPADEAMISGYLIWRIAFVSVIIATAAIMLFNRRFDSGSSLEAARTIAVNTLVAGQLFYLFNTRFMNRSALTLTGILSNRPALIAVGALVLIQLGFTYLNLSHVLFGTAPLPLKEWPWIIAAGAVVFLLVELEKAVMRRRGSQSSEPDGHKR